VSGADSGCCPIEIAYVSAAAWCFCRISQSNPPNWN
jgi:hypothetical protein